MLMAGIPDSYPISPGETIKPFDIALSILLQIGEYFQIQDDFLDYYIPPELLGKVGTGTKVNLGYCSTKANTRSRYFGQQMLLGDQHRPGSSGHHGGLGAFDASVIRVGKQRGIQKC